MNSDAIRTSAACPYCKAEARHLLSSTDKNRHTTDEVFEYLRCEDCGLISMKSPPQDMARYYRGGYDPIPESVDELRRIAVNEKSLGGIMVLAMPNPDSYEFSVLKGWWYHIDTPRHLQLIPLKTLADMCRKNHLRPVEITTAGKFSNIQSRQTWYNLGRSLVPVPFLNRLAGAASGRLLSLLTRRQQMTDGRGSAYTAIFQRH